MPIYRPLALFIGTLLLLGGARVDAQSPTRYGGGIQLVGSTVVKSAGPGLHVRTSFPMNRDFSFALGTTLTGFFHRGRTQAVYAFSPEASLIVTLPDPSNSSPYFLGGLGGHVPIGEGDRYEGVVAGPTFHLGLGKVWAQNTTSLYLELAPTLFFRRERTAVLLPLRGGLIF